MSTYKIDKPGEFYVDDPSEEGRVMIRINSAGSIGRLDLSEAAAREMIGDLLREIDPEEYEEYARFHGLCAKCGEVAEPHRLCGDHMQQMVEEGW